MILREATIKYKGYDPNDLSNGSKKRVCVSCDDCGRVKYQTYRNYNKSNGLCLSCSHSGKNHVNYGKHLSDETKRKIGLGNKGKVISDVARQKLSSTLKGTRCGDKNPMFGMSGELSPRFGVKSSYENRVINSCNQQGIDRDDFGGFIGRHSKRDYVLSEEKCIKMNKKFGGAHFHHITKSIGVYIPSELHRHISHNLRSGYNMGEMNVLAIQFINGGL